MPIQDDLEALRMDLVEFLNLYPLRAPRIMWFLGAGASVLAGLPTAGTLIWEFKRTLYCNRHKVSPVRFPNLEDPAFQSLVQDYFDSQHGFPALWADDEYSFYFEKYLPDEGDRRRFLEKQLSGIKPSYGHFCLAGLLALKQAHLVWTTNFDLLIERATGQDVITSHIPDGLTVISLDCPEKANDVFRDDRWPALVKIHGDFKYRKLMNTAQELQKQNDVLGDWLMKQCGRWGLAVVGYSGRDQSVLRSLEGTLSSNNDPFPHGLFWFVRAGERPRDAVVSLLMRARERGCQAAHIEIGGFDELMADLFRPHEETLPQIKSIVRAQRDKCQPVYPSYNGRHWPVIRTNALEITSYPSTCSVFEADIGGMAEVKTVIEHCRDRVTAGRKKKGVIAFGSRKDLLDAFRAHKPRAFDRHPIDPRHFRHEDNSELGLFYEAICQSLSRQTGTSRSVNRKGRILYLPSADILSDSEKAILSKLKIIPVRKASQDGPWIHEGVRISIEYQDLRLWLLLEPVLMVTIDGATPYKEADRHEIGREDLVRRYNKQANDLLVFWINFIASRCGSRSEQGQQIISLSYPNPQNCEAYFEVTTQTAFARGV